VDYKYVDTSEALYAIVKPLIGGPCCELAVDCEWGGEDHYKGALRTIQFSWAPGYSCTVILRRCGGIDAQSPEERMKMLKMVSALFTKPGMKLVGHNFRSDAKWLEYLGIPVMENFFFDTMLCDHIFNENAEHGLENCSVRYTTMGRYDWPLAKWLSDNKYNKKKLKTYGYMLIPDELLLPYSAADTVFALRYFISIAH
jgi:DNA polymerase I-like protein with 3'-5' exonuclease and polymerase domains